jgi:hypothetical protein
MSPTPNNREEERDEALHHSSRPGDGERGTLARDRREYPGREPLCQSGPAEQLDVLATPGAVSAARILTEPQAVVLDPEDDRLARYGIYVLRDGEPARVAECDLDAIGTTLVTLADELRDDGETHAETFGVLDQEQRRWISGLWPRRVS